MNALPEDPFAGALGVQKKGSLVDTEKGERDVIFLLAFLSPPCSPHLKYPHRCSGHIRGARTGRRRHRATATESAATSAEARASPVVAARRTGQSVASASASSTRRERATGPLGPAGLLWRRAGGGRIGRRGPGAAAPWPLRPLDIAIRPRARCSHRAGTGPAIEGGGRKGVRVGFGRAGIVSRDVVAGHGGPPRSRGGGQSPLRRPATALCAAAAGAPAGRRPRALPRGPVRPQHPQARRPRVLPSPFSCTIW